MYPVSVSDCPRPERGVFCILIVDIIFKSALVLLSLLCARNYQYKKGPVIADIITTKQCTEDYWSLSFYSKNWESDWLIFILLLVILQWKLIGWVIDINFIILSVRLNNKSYIFWYCLFNMWVLFGSTVCHLMNQIQPKTGNVLEFYFWFSIFLLGLCVPVH